MKTVFMTLAALLATLCTVSTALGGNFEPAADPTPKNASTTSVIEPSQPYYSLLTANEAPWITKLQEDITVSVGQQVVIMFQYAGTPMPKVDAIYHNGVEITNSDRYIKTSDQWGNYLFVIPEAQSDDTGRYTFIIGNIVGFISYTVNVTVV